ncbi:MAG: HAD family hydrolase [Planctomycetota bacterium]
MSTQPPLSIAQARPPASPFVPAGSSDPQSGPPLHETLSADLVVVDFDETLFLGNSTECFLDAARPRLLGALVLALLSAIRPWRWHLRKGLTTEQRDQFYRDHFRVWAVLLCAPWTVLLWRRRARAIMQEFENQELVAALQTAKHQEVVIASYGYRFIIRPLLKHATVPTDRLVAGGLFGGPSLRRNGKAKRLVQTLGEPALSEAAAITDSPRDRDLLDLVAQPALVAWPEVDARRAHEGVYLPLVYTQDVKRRGVNEVIRQVLLDDYALILLCIFAVNPLILGNLIGLTAAFFAFFCVYEVGYRENDLVAAKFESRPKLDPNHKHYESLGTMDSPAPWVWAMTLTALAAVSFNVSSWGETGFLVEALTTFGVWAGVLVTTRLLFRVYNHLNEPTRVQLFPMLQVAKTFGFLLLLPTTLAGGLFMLAQIVRRWMSYAAYRVGGDAPQMLSLVVRILAFVILSVGVAAAMQSLDLFRHWHFWALLGWAVIRAAGHLQLFARRSGRVKNSSPTA